MSYSTYVRYERRGDRVIPVRVTKQWVTAERPNHDSRKAPTQIRKFLAVQVTEMARFPRPDREALAEAPPEPYQSFPPGYRTETRDRLLTLSERGVPDGEPVVREAGYDQRWLPYSVPALPTASQAAWTLNNGNGWLIHGWEP